MAPKKQLKQEHKPLPKRKVTCGECSKVFENLKQYFENENMSPPPSKPF